MKELIPEAIIEEAYASQKAFVNAQISTKGIAGYKIAVASKSGQKNMGLSLPLAGVLYGDGVLANGCTINLKNYKQAKIETEIGYRLKGEVRERTDAIRVQNLIEEILPVFEIPDVTSDNPAEISVEELISKNTFGSHIVAGSAKPVGEIDPNSIVAELFHNDKLINTAPGTAAMDNQWEALAMALNLAVEHGYVPQQGDVVITGALGTIFTLEAGRYFADYGALGELRCEAI